MPGYNLWFNYLFESMIFLYILLLHNFQTIENQKETQTHLGSISHIL